MRNIFIVLMLLICINTRAQESQLVVKYDKAGNVIERKIQIVPTIKKPNVIKDSVAAGVPLTIYPNPTNMYLNIDGKLPESIQEAKLYLYTLSGVLVKKDIYYGTLKTLNVEDLKYGLYLLKVEFGEKKSQTYKIIITNQ